MTGIFRKARKITDTAALGGLSIDRSSNSGRGCVVELEDESQLRTGDAVAGLPGGAVGTNVSYLSPV